MKNLLIFLVFVAALITPAIVIVKNIQFKQQCSGYIKQAADANSVELAADRLQKAIDYAEANGLTSGYTSVLYKTEDENVGFWYQNLKTCLTELEEAKDATQLEKSNVLMKVRESLTDQGENGTVLTIPDGISRYPHNLLFGILRVLSYTILLVIGLGIYVKLG